MEQIIVAIDGDESITVRLSGMNGRWIASADTTDGPSLGLANDPLAAIYMALDPFQPRIDHALDAITLAASEACAT